MQFRFRAAAVVAFTMSFVAAMLASDASKAGAASATEMLPAQIRSPQDSVPAPTPSISSSSMPAVRFAAAREIVQPAPALAVADGTQPASSLAALVDAQTMPAALTDELRCLAGAVYFEAKSESLAGQLAVARVIINRVDSGRFASSICGVVYQRGQFSFVRGNSMPAINTDSRLWHNAVAIAQIAMKGAWDSAAEGALFFHARRVSPSWGRVRLASIDNHIFYR
jgi:spore germination cell wall hydrolase CwlJ-like protein